MATQRAISTISYNTEPFLVEVLDKLVKSHVFQAYQFIKHKGEDGDKDHIHVRVEPNKGIDKMELTDMLKEYPAGQEKPLGVRPWRFSKEEDWYLYAVHDKEYMRIKYPDDPHEKLPYEWQDIVVSDGYDLETAFIRAKATLKHSTSNITQRLKKGEKPEDLLLQGENPFLVQSISTAITKRMYGEMADKCALYENMLKGIAYAMTECDLYLYIKDGKYSLSFDGAEEDLGTPAEWPFELDYREYKNHYMTPAEKKRYAEKLRNKSKVYLTTEEEEWLDNYDTDVNREQEEREIKAKNRASFNLSEIDKGKKEEED